MLTSSESRILPVVTSREPEPAPELRGHSAPVVVRLRELPREDAVELLSSSAVALSQGQLARILTRAQGNPLASCKYSLVEREQFSYPLVAGSETVHEGRLSGRVTSRGRSTSA